MELTKLNILELHEAADGVNRLIAEVSYRRVMCLMRHERIRHL